MKSRTIQAMEEIKSNATMYEPGEVSLRGDYWDEDGSLLDPEDMKKGIEREVNLMKHRDRCLPLENGST